MFQREECKAASFVWQYCVVTNKTKEPRMQCKASVDAAPQQIVSFSYENSISFNVADSSSFA